MTVLEMIRSFRIGYDLINLSGPGYEDDEIIILLNQAQSIEVLKEIALKRWTYISKLIVNEQGALAYKDTYANDGSDKILSYTPIPSTEYIGYVSSMSHLTNSYIISSPQWVENILISKENAGKYMTSQINIPILLKPRVYEDSENNLPSISLIYDQYTTIDAEVFKLAYVRKPVMIAITGSPVNCEVNLIMHDRIVNAAVDLAKKVINPNEAAASVQTDQLMNRTVK
jgi:hypothetical protein